MFTKLLKSLLVALVMATMITTGTLDVSSAPSSPPGRGHGNTVELVVVESPPGTEDIRYGACGYAYLWLFDGPPLQGIIQIGAQTYWYAGPIVYVTWTVSVVGPRSFIDSGSRVQFSYYWSEIKAFAIAQWEAGFYSATLIQLDVWTSFGFHCVGLMPTDTEYIS